MVVVVQVMVPDKFVGSAGLVKVEVAPQLLMLKATEADVAMMIPVASRAMAWMVELQSGTKVVFHCNDHGEAATRPIS